MPDEDDDKKPKVSRPPSTPFPDKLEKMLMRSQFEEIKADIKAIGVAFTQRISEMERTLLHGFEDAAAATRQTGELIKIASEQDAQRSQSLLVLGQKQQESLDGLLRLGKSDDEREQRREKREDEDRARSQRREDEDRAFDVEQRKLKADELATLRAKMIWAAGAVVTALVGLVVAYLAVR